MNRIERIIHGLIGEIPGVRVPLVSAYQRICSIVPTRNYEYSPLLACLPGYFFGFHDKCPWAPDDSKLLAHHFDTNSHESDIESRPIEVGYFDQSAYCNFHVVGNTRAWNWQQGACLQWAGDTGRIIYNDYVGDDPVALIVDVESHHCERLHGHVMATSHNGQFALSLNFDRLGKGMPGYGYRSKSDDLLSACMMPENDGLRMMDLGTGNDKLFLGLKEIACSDPKEREEAGYHFFSHCLFSPGDKRFAFFHRCLKSNGHMITNMYSCGLDDVDLWKFPGSGFSHIAWMDDARILAYCKPYGSVSGFYVFDVFSRNIIPIAKNVLTSDGHPQLSSCGKYILVDTYPDRHRNQRLKIYNIQNGTDRTLIKYRIPFRYRYESRCDFHPRWSRDNKKICFDSSHNGVRSLCILRSPIA